MRHSILITSVFSALVLACGTESTTSTVRAASPDVAGELDAEHAEARQRLDGLEARLAELKARISEAGSAIGEEWRDRLGQLEHQRDVAARHLAEWGDAAAEGWEVARQGFEDALRSLRKGLDEAADTIREEI
jgi:chromosome segregation ATPase